MTQEVLAAIKDADLVLVGIGEEFDEAGISKTEAIYQKGREQLEQGNKLWLLPYFDSCYRNQNSADLEQRVWKGLTQLAEVLKDKNYFVVSTAMNDKIADVPWKEGRLVMPCGSMNKKQCPNACEESLQELTEAEQQDVIGYIQGMLREISGGSGDESCDASIELCGLYGVCPKCGKPFVLNNVYTENYDERGYLSQWQLYTKWLQGTLNKKLVILELGVGMKFPSVIRFPFEKVAYFNQKAHMYRVNERLYHLSEELKGKGTAIAKNSIDWLDSLC